VRVGHSTVKRPQAPALALTNTATQTTVSLSEWEFTFGNTWGDVTEAAMTPPLDLAHQRVVVVGAASGIGRATALHLHQLGAEVFALDVNAEGAKETCALMGDGADARYGHVDVTDPASVDAAFLAIRSSESPIRGVVNCAGITGRTGISTHEVEPADFDRVYAVNLRGALLVSQAVLPDMVRMGYGRLLHLASISGKDGNAGMAAYSSTKAGLIGLVKVMGKEYARSGVTVNALAPAVIRTPMVDALPDSQVSYMTDKIPMGRPGTLEEVAHMVAWIVSPQCSYVTGFTFDLSGGRAVY